MMQKVKYLLGIVVTLILLLCGVKAWYYYHEPFHVVGSRIPVFMKQVVAELNQMPEFKGKHYTIYAAGFDDANTIPHFVKHNQNAILWMGGKVLFNAENAENFGTIVTINPYKQTELKKLNIKAFYLPMGFVETGYSITRGVDFIVIGNPPYIENLLKTKKLRYRKYTWQEVIENPQLVSNVRAVIAGDPLDESLSLEMPDILLNLMRAEVPVIAQWKGERTVSLLYWFNDHINFYMYEKDAAVMIEEIRQNTPLVRKRVKENKRFVEKYFSVQGVADSLREVLLLRPVKYEDVSLKSLTLNIPTMVGHYGAGDYWLGKDMEDELTQLGYKVDSSFINSQYLLPAETYIRLRGYATDYDSYRFGLINLFYLIYMGIDYQDENSYTQQLKKSMQGSDVFISASKYWANKMAKLGYESYYLPQFTNPHKFYYDYDERLKSEVLFVGNFHFYRKGLIWAIKQGAPITIYGDYYPNGMTKGKYVDNRILRKYYSSAKIVLNDAMDTMKHYGFVSNRIFDATACGALVISDYMPEIKEIYGDSIPMYKDEKELLKLINYYLQHDDERQRLAKKAQQITLKNYTAKQAMQKVQQIILRVKAKKMKLNLL